MGQSLLINVPAVRIPVRRVGQAAAVRERTGVVVHVDRRSGERRAAGAVEARRREGRPARPSGTEHGQVYLRTNLRPLEVAEGLSLDGPPGRPVVIRVELLVRGARQTIVWRAEPLRGKGFKAHERGDGRPQQQQQQEDTACYGGRWSASGAFHLEIWYLSRPGFVVVVD